MFGDVEMQSPREMAPRDAVPAESAAAMKQRAEQLLLLQQQHRQRPPLMEVSYLIGQKFVGQNCRNFDLVSKILSDEKFSPTKILSVEILSDKVVGNKT